MTHSLQDEIGRNLQHDNPEKHELVAQIHRVLADCDVFGEPSSECACQVHAIQLENEESKEEKGENGRINSGNVRLITFNLELLLTCAVHEGLRLDPGCPVARSHTHFVRSSDLPFCQDVQPEGSS